MPPEDIPEIPPFPQHLSIQLYSIVDVEHLLSRSTSELDVAVSDNVTHDHRRTVEGPPFLGQPLQRHPDFPLLDRRLSEQEAGLPEFSLLPHKLSIGLYSLADAQQLQLPILEDAAAIQGIPPSPQQLSVDLYCLPDVHQIHGDTGQRNTLRDIPEIPASPTQVSVDLYPLNDVESLISGDATSSSLGVFQSAAQPEPLSDSRTDHGGGASDVQQFVGSDETSDGPVAFAVQEIVEACERMKIYKHRSKVMSAQSEQISGTFNDIAGVLQGLQLQQLTDELVRLLEGVMRVTKQYSNYNAVETFLKSTKIKKGLDQCETALRDAQTLCLQAESTVTQPPNIPKKEKQRLTSEELGEQRGLLLDILNLTPADLRRQIDALEGLLSTNAATQLAAAGHEELRRLREKPKDSAASGSRDIQSPSQLPPGEVYDHFQRGLVNLHRVTGIPPTKILLNGEVGRTSEAPIAGGTFGDIWKGTWLEEEKVALKALKNTDSLDSKAIKRFGIHINIWSHIKHENILGVWGMVSDLDRRIYIVSPWQENGNVLEYARDHPDISRLELMSGASQGLSYLHRSNNIIHGNIKCANILVSSKGQACISDFGLAKVIEEGTERSASLMLTEGGSVRWMAPELIEGKAPSQEADIYSFAMTILELMTGKHPYAECEQDAQVIHSIVVLKKTPARPQGEGSQGPESLLSDELWSLMLRCWCKEATARPPMTEVCSSLVDISRPSTAGLLDNPQ